MSHWLKPLGARVVVRQQAAPEVLGLSGRLHASSAHAEPPCEGVVLELGPECSKLMVGDLVVWPRWSGLDSPSADLRDKVLLLQESEIWGKVDAAAREAEREVLRLQQERASEELLRERALELERKERESLRQPSP